MAADRDGNNAQDAQMSRRSGQKTHTSPSGGAAARLARVLEHLRNAEAGLKAMNREGLAAMRDTLEAAARELRALQEELLAAGPAEYEGAWMQSAIRELGGLNQTVQALLRAAKEFHGTLLRIHQTEQDGYGSLVAAAGAQPRIRFRHRLETRG